MSEHQPSTYSDMRRVWYGWMHCEARVSRTSPLVLSWCHLRCDWLTVQPNICASIRSYSCSASGYRTTPPPPTSSLCPTSTHILLAHAPPTLATFWHMPYPDLLLPHSLMLDPCACAEYASVGDTSGKYSKNEDNFQDLPESEVRYVI